MQPIHWITTPEFLKVWKGAFREIKHAFVSVSANARASSKRERTGGLWTQIQHPYPGVHLLAIELQPDVTPLTIRFKVWIDQSQPDLYSRLRSSPSPELLGQRTILSVDQRPRSSWESQLNKAGISLLGLSYRLPDLSFLCNEVTAGTDLRRTGEAFAAWLIISATFDESRIDAIDTSAVTTEVVQSAALTPKTALELEQQLQAKIQESRDLTAEARRKRLSVSSTIPLQIQVQARAFIRNADVIVDVLERAAGRCAKCGNVAPFLRATDGSPYLEVHHVVQLSNGGEDSVANAQALCPNCHRRIHHG